MSISLAEVAKVLESDLVLLKEVTKFSDALEIPATKVFQLKNQFVLGAITTYELFHGILSHWISKTGRGATVQTLQVVLNSIGLKNCADVLEEVTKSYPTPIKVSYITASTSHSILTRLGTITFGVSPGVLNFIGRTKELVELDELFSSTTFNGVVISGLGGIGKTELTKKFTLDKKLDIGTSTNLIKSWLSGDNAQSLRTSLSNFCQHLGISSTDTAGRQLPEEELLDNLKSSMNQNHLHRWLVVIDNVDDVYTEFKTVARKLITFGHTAFLLVTSRSRDIFPGELELLEVKEFPIQDSLEFVKSSLRIRNNLSNEGIIELCRRLGNHPLALVQAVSYLKQQRALSLLGEAYGVQDYLSELEESDIAGLDMERELAEYPHTTLKVWNMTITKISEGTPDGQLALRILNMLAFLSPDDIHLEMIGKMYKCFHGTAELEDIETALRLLVKYSMIRSYAKVISIHRLVQLVLRTRLGYSSPVDGDNVEQMLGPFWNVLNVNSWSKSEMNHIVYIWNYSSRYPNLVKAHAALTGSIYHRMHIWAMFNESYDFALRNQTLFTRTLGQSHAETLRMEKLVANALMEKGQYKEALEGLKLVHEKQTVVFGEGHEETLMTVMYIMTDLLNLGGYEEIMTWCERILELKAIELGENDEGVIKLRSNLASLTEYPPNNAHQKAMAMSNHVVAFFEMGKDVEIDNLEEKQSKAADLFKGGKYQEAFEIFETILIQQEAFYGNGHPDTLLSKFGLASTLDKLGECEKSLQMYKDILLVQEEQLGPEHPDSLRTRNEIAVSLSNAGGFAEARDTLESVLDSRVQTLGPDHPETLDTKRHLACALDKLGGRAEALVMHEELLEKRLNVLGSNHHDTLITRRDLAIILHKDEKYLEALEMFKTILKLETELLGDEHLDVINSKNWLARTFEKLNEHEQAKILYQEILVTRERRQGHEHPDTLSATQDLASCFFDMGNYTKARCMFENVLKLREKIIGPEHPSTLNTKASLANTFTEMGLNNDSQRLLEELLVTQEKVLGPKNPELLETQHDLAMCHYEQGQFSVAKDMFQMCLNLRMGVLGEDDSDTLETKLWLANTFRKLEEFDESVRILLEVLAVQEKSGDSTLETQSNIALCYYHSRRFAQAREAYLLVLESQVKTLEEEHPDTLDTKSELIDTLLELNEVEEALRMCNRLLIEQENLLGAHHIDTLKTERRVGICYFKNRSFAEASNIFRKLIQSIEGIPVSDIVKQFRVRTITWLADSIRQLGEMQEALEMYSELVVEQIEIFGEQHSHTISTRSKILELELSIKNTTAKSGSESPPAKKSKDQEIGHIRNGTVNIVCGDRFSPVTEEQMDQIPANMGDLIDPNYKPSSD